MSILNVYYPLFSSIPGKLSKKRSPSNEIWRLFDKPLTADDKYGIKFRAFPKKRWVSSPNYFRNYWCTICFRTPFAGFQTLEIYYSLFPSVRGNLSWKKSPSVWYEILRLFVYSADDKYSGGNMQNLPQLFQLHCALNLEHFQKKDEYPRLIISEIIDAERRGNLNV